MLVSSIILTLMIDHYTAVMASAEMAIMATLVKMGIIQKIVVNSRIYNNTSTFSDIAFL